MVHELKKINSIVFTHFQTTSLSTPEGPIRNRAVGYRDLSLLLLTKGAKLKLRHFHSPDAMHWYTFYTFTHSNVCMKSFSILIGAIRNGNRKVIYHQAKSAKKEKFKFRLAVQKLGEFYALI